MLIPIIMVLVTIHGRLRYPVYGINLDDSATVALVVSLYYGGAHMVSLLLGGALIILGLVMRGGIYGGAVGVLGVTAGVFQIVGHPMASYTLTNPAAARVPTGLAIALNHWPHPTLTRRDGAFPRADQRKSPCDAWPMSDKPRYRLRSNSNALTPLQWWIVGMAVLVGVFGLGLGLTGVIPAATGGGIAGLAALVSSGVLVSAGSHQPRRALPARNIMG